ncbi:hypothetical protein DFJ74DRAFT_531402 [Hyaloraphidium curvatum]|nr:hypothetical protein DFJ74DRAFT_531402 [Hyaloraphidium curvatum]
MPFLVVFIEHVICARFASAGAFVWRDRLPSADRQSPAGPIPPQPCRHPKSDAAIHQTFQAMRRDGPIGRTAGLVVRRRRNAPNTLAPNAVRAHISYRTGSCEQSTRHPAFCTCISRMCRPIRSAGRLTSAVQGRTRRTVTCLHGDGPGAQTTMPPNPHFEPSEADLALLHHALQLRPDLLAAMLPAAAPPPPGSRACGLPGCGAAIPPCAPVPVFRHRNRVRVVVSAPGEPRLRLGEAVTDATQCRVAGHYTQEHNDESHRVCDECGKSAGYVCLFHLSGVDAPPTEHLCSKCGAKQSGNEIDRSRSRLGDTRFSRGQPSRVSNLQQHLAGESHCGLPHYLCPVCPVPRMGGFATKSDFANHCKTGEHVQRAAGVLVGEVAGIEGGLDDDDGRTWEGSGSEGEGEDEFGYVDPHARCAWTLALASPLSPSPLGPPPTDSSSASLPHGADSGPLPSLSQDSLAPSATVSQDSVAGAIPRGLPWELP